jgi:O-antigen ligase
MNKSERLPKATIYLSFVISIVVTPWVNVDSMIVPKVIILFCLSFYLLPQINILSSLRYRNILFKLLLMLVILIIIQMVLVLIFTEAPLEQQIFGRGGRGLGFLTYLSLMIVLIAVSVFFSTFKFNLLINGILSSCAISSVYSVLQYFGLDIINWVTKTNGIIGTLGNPNFQSVFAAMALPLSFTLLKVNKLNYKMAFISLFLLSIYTIYICRSFQGYIAGALSLITVTALYLFQKSKVGFNILLPNILLLIFIVGAGIFNSGPLSGLLYKSSVESRNEMWRTSWSTSTNNPIFGIGLDSFGDYSNYYKSPADAAGINEYIDNSHNYFLEYAATGGYALALLHIALIALTVFSFLKLISNVGKFDLNLAAIFGSWVAFQAQSLISPANISLLLWNFIITGFIIGAASENLLVKNSEPLRIKEKNTSVKMLSTPLLIVALLISYPYFNADRLLLKSSQTGNLLLAVQSAKMYPESVIRYQKVGVELLQAGFVEQSVEIARAAVEFNPDSFYGWALLLSSNSIEEKNKAVKELKRLDPYNKIVMELEYFE